ncbi:MAG: hypothetical protein JSW06_11400 [Thermoplasmatales archaeon]|nr:MAG: hypothetical protein JSW06_11400 [Thermoplasmatales archaeon]
MNKNDKLIVVIGVLVLVIALIGIYTWKPMETTVSALSTDEFFSISSSLSYVPNAIAVSDSDPFYALIATPLAVNYDQDGNQSIIPLYIQNFSNPSQAIEKAVDRIGSVTEIIDTSKSAEEWSLEIAQEYWESSDAVLLIENNESGYNLGIAASPIASYLSIPVIVVDELDLDVKEVLEDLGVKYSLVCGDIKGHRKTLKFNDFDDILNTSIDLVMQKFGDVEYITLTNPMDARTPEVLNEEIVLSEKGKLTSIAPFPSNFLNLIKGIMNPTSFSVKIPEDYKYALVKLDFRNLENPEHIEKFGDNVLFGGKLTGYMRTTAYPAKRDANGNVEEDRLYFETIIYDMGGEEYEISLTGVYNILDSAEFELTVTIEELSNPYYPMMKQFSSIAPYLTAYHKGIVFAEPEFAFAPSDDVKLNGKKLPGNTQPFYNPMLIPVINQHVYENIHIPLNKLLAKITDIDTTESVESLKKDCYQDPFYIALVGDTIMLPQYYYRSPHNDPFERPANGAYGTNCPSDFIYGNIDPDTYSLLPYDSDHLENDLYSEYPEVENIVGRITGWDVQDASALIARTIFYDKVIDELDTWKDNAAVLVGAGTEVQRLPIFNTIHKILGRTDPMKFPTGEKRFLVKRIKNNFEKGGFNAQSAERGAAQRVGFSMDAIRELNKDGIANRLFFPWLRVKFRQGIENIESFRDPEWWIKTIFGDSSELVIGGELEQGSNLIISDSHAIWFEKESGDILMHSLGGPFYEIFTRYIPILPLRSTLDGLGAYTVRDVPNMDMGPSVMLIEGCGSGKIDGFLPINSLANAYLHAGVNAYISPTTFSAFYGALEPRPNFNGGVGFGIIGYLKAWSDWRFKGEYPKVCFNQVIFEHAILEMFNDDVSIGTALRDAKNIFLPETFYDEFRWKPVLSIPSNLPGYLREDIQNRMKTTASGGLDHHPVEKYCTVYQINLLGDPAFNPYEPINEGS